MANKRLTTHKLKTAAVTQFIEDIGNSNYYVFIGNHIPFPGGDTQIPQPNNSVECLDVDVYKNMIAAKRIMKDDAAILIRRYNWRANEIYVPYDHTNGDLFSEPFYVVTDDVSEYHVFKCLYNNNGALSTEQPNFSDTSPVDDYYETSDGYQWKYMYTVQKSIFDRFANKDYIPVVYDENVSGNARPGTIDVIQVLSPGQKYNNYYSGQFTIQDIRVGGNTVLYGLSNTASGSNGYYSGSLITIVEGTGKGQYREITDYRVIGTSKEVVINAPFETLPDATSLYDINPRVVVTGDGSETAPVVARALINNFSGNTVHKIEILSGGANYRAAVANIFTPNVVAVTSPATLKVIIPPKGGHGANAALELGGTNLGLSVQFSNNESNTISSTNDYRTIGVIKQPSFANVALSIIDSSNVPGSDGVFLNGERAIQYDPVWLKGTVTISPSSPTLTGNGTNFTMFKAGDNVLVQAGNNLKKLVTIAGVTNTTSMTMTSNGTFSSSNADHGIIAISAIGQITSVTTGTLSTTNACGNYEVGKMVIGEQSGATATINAYTVTGVSKNFSTINQLSSLGGIIDSGSFDQDEWIYMTSNVGVTARLHSATPDTIKFTNKNGNFINGQQVVGNTSAAIFTTTNKYDGDFNVGSGEVFYIENMQPVPRHDDQSETYKIILEF